MYALKQPLVPFKSSLAGGQRSTGKFIKLRRAHVSGFRARPNGLGSVRAVISGGDKAAVEEASTPPLQSEDVSGSLKASSSSPIEVKAVVTIRKKMKEKVLEKIEDQLEFFINGIGQEILIQLISEEIDPGKFNQRLNL